MQGHFFFSISFSFICEYLHGKTVNNLTTFENCGVFSIIVYIKGILWVGEAEPT